MMKVYPKPVILLNEYLRYFINDIIQNHVSILLNKTTKTEHNSNKISLFKAVSCTAIKTSVAYMNICSQFQVVEYDL